MTGSTVCVLPPGRFAAGPALVMVWRRGARTHVSATFLDVGTVSVGSLAELDNLIRARELARRCLR